MVEHLLMHDNQLVDEQLLNPDACQKEIGVTLVAHPCIQHSLTNS